MFAFYVSSTWLVVACWHWRFFLGKRAAAHKTRLAAAELQLLIWRRSFKYSVKMMNYNIITLHEISSEMSRKGSTVAEFMKFEMSNALLYDLSLLLVIKRNKSATETNWKGSTIA